MQRPNLEDGGRQGFEADHAVEHIRVDPHRDRLLARRILEVAATGRPAVPCSTPVAAARPLPSNLHREPRHSTSSPTNYTPPTPTLP